ncbi:hypothetical protein JAN5088_03269 [Jannaschia rubra]|uniref:Uncharacterized protein n=1 Tax=Jannaschia rubra TaxID=282197 RepID=A0A0M6XW04_9RHOB|nr:hypothetical protein JAN5088_03269 [Jannaschia rubra]
MPEEGALVRRMGGTTGVVTDLEKEAPNVVTEARFRQLLAKGYQAEIVCREDAYTKASVWYGEWIIRVVDQERSVEKLLVNIPRRLKADSDKVITLKVFKTINGLSTFMHRTGFTHVHVPFHKGGRSIQALPNEVSQADNGSAS